jgi:hypothetical protein
VTEIYLGGDELEDRPEDEGTEGRDRFSIFLEAPGS